MLFLCRAQRKKNCNNPTTCHAGGRIVQEKRGHVIIFDGCVLSRGPWLRKDFDREMHQADGRVSLSLTLRMWLLGEQILILDAVDGSFEVQRESVG